MLRSSVLLFLLLFATGPLRAQPIAIIARAASPVESRYLAFLQQALDARHVAHDQVRTTPAMQPGAWIFGAAGLMRVLLTPAQYRVWARAPQAQGDEGYAVTPVPVPGGRALVLSFNQPRGELFGMGWLLRTAVVRNGRMVLPTLKAFATDPDKAVRGYQIGYRMKNNTYDAWTLAQFQQQMLDLAVFGLNTMQVVAPVSDDDPTSPLFPAPAEETVIGLSQMSKDYGLRYDLFYPEMANDYTDPAQAVAELKQFEDLVRKLPQLDSVHIPGGDPGHTPPEVLLPLIQKEAVILHRYHPAAKVWISAQGFTAERYRRFYAMMPAATYIDGVFFGPQSRESMEQQRTRLPARVPIEFYPDTAHAMHAQFPVPEWDPVFALTEGREPINPRPAQFEHMYRHFHDLNTGFMVYSEGVNDDVNKVLWGGWGWDLNRPAHETLRDYARYFFMADEREAGQVALAIEGLEKNWEGPLLRNTGIAGTLAMLQRLHPAGTKGNWRWNSSLYRAEYDRFVQLKRKRALDAEKRALAVLDGRGAADARIRQSRRILDGSVPEAEERRLRGELGQLAEALFHECGLQLSVKLYGASNWERGANFDRVDTPLNDRTWIEKRLSKAESEHGEAQEKLLHAITHWTRPTPGALYDDLGDPANESHRLRGTGWAADPEMYHTAIDGIADTNLENGWRLSWLDYAETLYEEPLRLRYTGLAAGKYQVRITYAGEGYKLPMELRANGVLVQPFRLRASNPEEVLYDLPATNKGTITLEWRRQYGAGGGDRGGQVAEVWLLPESSLREPTAIHKIR